jgi:hypothetical protein
MSGLQVKYAELLRLSVTQLFYQNQVCRRYQAIPRLDITLTPTDDCLSVMQRMDLLFRNTDNTGGFIVFARVLGTNGAGNDLLRFPARAGDKLSFWMLLNNAHLLNFDDLPVQPAGGQVYFFSNQLADAAALRTNLHLSADPLGVKGANDTIKSSAEIYRYHSATPVAVNTAKVMHLLTGVSIDPASLIVLGGQTDLIFDLTSLPSGKCQLLISNTAVEQFYYAGALPPRLLFGVIELSLNAALAANYRVVEADRSLTPARPFYSLLFNNRSTTWRYTVSLTPQSPLYLEMAALSPADKTTFINELNIVTNDSSIAFNRDSVTDTAIVFVSQATVALREKYLSSSSLTHDALSLTLKKYIGDAAKEAVVKTDLPFPSTSVIDATQSPQIYSDIFLTL